MRPRTDDAAAAGRWLGVAELSQALAPPRAPPRPRRTVTTWLAAWHAAGVALVRRVPAAGRYGVRYEAHPSLPRKWREGRLPPPWPTPA